MRRFMQIPLRPFSERRRAQLTEMYDERAAKDIQVCEFMAWLAALPSVALLLRVLIMPPPDWHVNLIIIAFIWIAIIVQYFEAVGEFRARLLKKDRES